MKNVRETKRHRYIRALLALGEREVECRSRKYRQFTMTEGKSTGRLTEGQFWFLGKSGALRFGRLATTSYSALAAMGHDLLRRGDEAAR